MRVACFSEAGYTGKVPRNNPNMRTDQAWVCALDAIHFPVTQLPNEHFDIGIVIIPKEQNRYLLASNNAININLTDIFALNRSFLTTQYTNDYTPNGGFGQQFVQNADELWVCVLDANIPADYGKDIIWASAFTTNATPAYEDPRASNYDLNAIIYITLSAIEV